MAISNQCKNCGSRLSFDAKSQCLKCSHCETELAINSSIANNDKYTYSSSSIERMSANKNEQFKCCHCGNIHIVSGDNIKLVCPTCGSRDFDKTVEVTVEPDGIIPFKLNKTDAGSFFAKWIRRRFLAPNNLKKLAKLNKLSGVYFPIWNYDFTDTFTYSGTGINIHRDRKGNVHRSTHVFRNTITTNEQNFFVNANNKIDDQTIRKLTPFAFEKMQTFCPEFMYGWIGTEKNVALHESVDELKKDVYKIRNDQKLMELRFKYDDINFYKSSISFSNIKYNYIYLPIWINHYSYKEKSYHCYINGVTGKTVGKSPISIIKAIFLGLGIAAIIALIYYLKNFT